MTRRRLLAGAAVAAAITACAGTIHDVSACGGLVAPNGAVRLERASTAVAWHDGVERYLTSFSYQGDVPDIGWIVPLPAIPDSVVKGGSWALQRMAREAQPFRAEPVAFAATASGAGNAEVVLKTTVDSLDITVIKGSGQAVSDWCATNGFALNDETRAHILSYAESSPIFLAAKYDTNAARARGFFQGDGTPVLVTMRTPRLWIPLEVLATGHDQLTADLFLFTDERPAPVDQTFFLPGFTVAGASGFQLVKQEPIPQSLHDDLAAQPNMEWVPRDGWFTALTINAPGNVVTYDMTVDSGRMTLAPMGMGPDAVTKPATIVAPNTGAASIDPGAAPTGGIEGGLIVAGASIAGALLLAGAAAWVVAVIERRRARRAC
jgi:hypothetical protein